MKITAQITSVIIMCSTLRGYNHPSVVQATGRRTTFATTCGQQTLLLVLYYSPALGSVKHKSMSLQYEPSSEQLHNPAKLLFLNTTARPMKIWATKVSIRVFCHYEYDHHVW